MANGLCFPTILVAEPDERVREPLVRHLRQQGYFVLVAQDATEALEITRVHSRPIHLLLTSEGLDGRTLAATLKQYRPGMQVLFLAQCLQPDPAKEKETDSTLDRVRQYVKPPAALSGAYPRAQAKSA